MADLATETVCFLDAGRPLQDHEIEPDPELHKGALLDVAQKFTACLFRSACPLAILNRAPPEPHSR